MKQLRRAVLAAQVFIFYWTIAGNRRAFFALLSENSNEIHFQHSRHSAFSRLLALPQSVRQSRIKAPEFRSMDDANLAAYQLVGRFVSNFSALERELNRAIYELGSLQEPKGFAIISHNYFPEKARILRALIDHNAVAKRADWKKQARVLIRDLEDMSQIGDFVCRTPFFGTVDSRVKFVVEPGQEWVVVPHELWSETDFHERIAEIVRLAHGLKELVSELVGHEVRTKEA